MRIHAALTCLLLATASTALHAQRVGEFSLRAGSAIATPADGVLGGAGPAVEASFGTRFGSVVILLEGAYLGISDVRHVWRYGLGARGEFGQGEWRPYVVGGMGGYSDEGRRLESFDGEQFPSSLSWFGVNAGAGLRREFGRSPFSLMAETRVHVRAQRVYPENNVLAVEMISVLAGGTVSW